MSITLRVVDLLDRLKVQRFFIERNQRTYFTPIRISFNQAQLEKISDRLFKVKGNAYKMNDLEKEILEELDF
ncbi:MAG: hypothetical protein ACJAS4_003300 [Bacteriovoracaceae bacterium]|jgi:hypothetical protein